ncbi:MAG: GTP-binding protein [Bacteroidota bacterium]
MTSSPDRKNFKGRVPVVILNGFLGSGKTTLLRNLMVQSSKKKLSISVIVNDMSELDVDGEIISNTEIVRREDSNFESIHSCVLSSRRGIEKLDQVLKKMLADRQNDLLIIETSGSCHPMPLIEYFKNHASAVLTGVFALVDSLMLAQDHDLGKAVIPHLQRNLTLKKRDPINLLVEQIMFCSHLILTKADRLKEGQLQLIAKAIHPLNPHVSIVSVSWGKLAVDEILALPIYNFHRVVKLIKELKPVLEPDTLHERPYDLATRVLKDDRPFHPQRLWDTCNQYLGEKIYRSKGFFWFPTRDKISLLWNQAAGSISLELVGYWRTGVLEEEDNGLLEVEKELLKEKLAKEKGQFGDRHCHLTIIGDKQQVDPFSQALEKCFLTKEEISHWQAGGTFADPWPKNMVKME